MYIQTNNLAGQGDGTDPLMVTVTARSHLDVQNNLPANYDIYAGVITLTKEDGDLAKEGLGVHGFAIDTDYDNGNNPNYGRRYDDGMGNGFIVEGSKEVSGGVDYTDRADFVCDNPTPPENSPPHVDEDVMFSFNTSLVIIPADPEKDTDEHFLINGFSADYTIVPEPTTFAIFGFGALLLRKRKA